MASEGHAVFLFHQLDTAGELKRVIEAILTGANWLESGFGQMLPNIVGRLADSFAAGTAALQIV